MCPVLFSPKLPLCVTTLICAFNRRSVVENEVKNNQTSEDEFQNMLRVITWLPLCWHHVNRCLEGQSAGDVTIGTYRR